MAKHVISLPASTPLPSPLGLAEGSALILGGALHHIQDGQWVAPSPSGGEGGGGDGGGEAVAGSLVWRGQWVEGVAYPAGSVVADQDDLYLATVDLEANYDPPYLKSDALVRMSDPAVGPDALTRPFDQGISASTFNAAVRFQVSVPMDADGVRLAYAPSSEEMRSGTIGISSTDPAAGEPQWLAKKASVYSEGVQNGDDTYTATFAESAQLDPEVDYWLVFDGTAPALGVLRPSTGTALATLPSSDIIFGAEGLRTGAAYDGVPAKAEYPVIRLHRAPSGPFPLRRWATIYSHAWPPSESPAMQGNAAPFKAPDGALWSISVSNAGAVTAVPFPAPANDLLAGATVIGMNGYVEATLLGATTADSKATPATPSVWFKIAATGTFEMSLITRSSRALEATIWTTESPSPAVGNLTRVSESAYFSSGEELVITHPWAGAVFFVEISAYDEVDMAEFDLSLVSRML